MALQRVLLAVDADQSHLDLITQFLEGHGYRVLTASTLEELDRALLEPVRPRLALVDIAGFERGIWERCERMRDAGIPFMIIFPREQSKLSCVLHRILQSVLEWIETPGERRGNR